MLQMSYYTMKFRLGQQNPTKRDEILFNRMHLCPGNKFHNHPRREIVFKRYVSRCLSRGHADTHKAYVMYWRSHPAEYAEMIANIKNKV